METIAPGFQSLMATCMRKPLAHDDLMRTSAPSEQKCFAMLTASPVVGMLVGLPPVPNFLPLPGVSWPPQNVHALHMQNEQSYVLSEAEHQLSHNSLLESPGLAELHWELALTSALAPRVRSAMRIAQLPIAVLRDGIIIIASLSAAAARATGASTRTCYGYEYDLTVRRQTVHDDTV
jgi:hypothetical protein